MFKTPEHIEKQILENSKKYQRIYDKKQELVKKKTELNKLLVNMQLRFIHLFKNFGVPFTKIDNKLITTCIGTTIFVMNQESKLEKETVSTQKNLMDLYNVSTQENLMDLYNFVACINVILDKLIHYDPSNKIKQQAELLFKSHSYIVEIIKKINSQDIISNNHELYNTIAYWMENLGTDDLNFLLADDKETIQETIFNLVESKFLIDLQKNRSTLYISYFIPLIIFNLTNAYIFDGGGYANDKLLEIGYANDKLLEKVNREKVNREMVRPTLPVNKLGYHNKQLFSMLDYNCLISDIELEKYLKPIQDACAETATHRESMPNLSRASLDDQSLSPLLLSVAGRAQEHEHNQHHNASPPYPPRPCAPLAL